MSEWIEKIKNLQQNFSASIEKSNFLSGRVIWLGVIGILLLVCGSIFDGNLMKSSIVDDSPTKSEAPRQAAEAILSAGKNGDEAFIEAKIAHLLSRVKGAGNVEVNVTLEGSARREHAKNVTRETKIVEEKDPSGGVRTTSESKESAQVLMSKEGGADKPVMVSEIRPEVKGILIVAEGAGDSAVKANLTRAVETGLGIASYKITVLPQGK